MKSPFVTLTLCLLAIGLSSCTKNETILSPDFSLVRNIQWRLVAFDTLVGRTVYLSSTDTIYFFLEETRVVRGRSHGECGNYYDGVYHFGGANLLRFDSLGSTEALCPSSRYWNYFDRFKTVTTFGVNGSQLYLYYDNNRQKLLLEK